MGAPADELRRQLRALAEARARGDVPERQFQRRQTELGVLLYRAVVSERLAGDEAIVAEHHLVHSHFKATQSLLRDPEQVMVSFFATARRVFRVRELWLPGRPLVCDLDEGATVDEVAYGRIRGVARRRQRRWGEVGVGLGAAALALLFGKALAVTGPALVVVGLAGAAHGFLLPTRWVELELDGELPAEPFAIHGVRRKAGRALVAAVRAGRATVARTAEGVT